MLFGVRIWLGLTAAMMLQAAAVAHAHPDDEPGRAHARVQFGASQPLSLSWRGRGDVGASQTMCITSTTGQFELRISSLTGSGLWGEASMPYEVSVEIDGRVQSGTITRQSPVFSFFGRTNAARTCRGRHNARLTVRLLHTDAMAGVAGSYADRIQVSVEPR